MPFIPDTIKPTSGFVPDISEEEAPTRFRKTGFLERLKLGFGGSQAKAQQQLIEKGKGLKGRFDIGDIADVAGSALPVLGGILGTAGGTIGGVGVGGFPGGAIGATAGQAAKQAIGGLLGVRKEATPAGEFLKPLGAGALEYAGGRFGAYVFSRLPKLLGIATGEGDDAIRAALSNPKKADLGIQQGDEALRNAVAVGGEKTIQMRNQFGAGYREAFNKIVEKYPNKLISRQKVLYEFVDDLVKQGVRVEDGTLNFATSRIKANPGEIGKINAAYEAITQWKDFSFKGVNELKQLVGSLTKFADEAGIPSKSPFLGKYYRYLDDTIKGSLKEQDKVAYGIMNKRYSDGVEMYDDLVDAFNKGDPFTRLSQALSANKDTLREVLKFYDKQTGEGILSTIAGRQIGAEKEAAFGFLNPRSWIDFFWSPKLQGAFITRTGKITNPIRKTVSETYQGFQKSLGVDPLRPLRFK